MLHTVAVRSVWDEITANKTPITFFAQKGTVLKICCFKQNSHFTWCFSMVYERQFLVLLIGCTLVHEEVTCNRFSATACWFWNRRENSRTKTLSSGTTQKIPDFPGRVWTQWRTTLLVIAVDVKVTATHGLGLGISRYSPLDGLDNVCPGLHLLYHAQHRLVMTD